MVGWISRYLPDGFKPALQRPLNYIRIITVTTTILGIISFLSVAYPYILPVVQNRNLWAGISLITILLFTSGHMFNHIRKVPYVAGNGQGGISYFAGGFSNQFGMETQIVAAMCMFPQSKAPLRKFILTVNLRWHAFLRDHCFSPKSPSYAGSQEAAIGRFHLGGRDVWHVQLLAQRLQN